jgi:hypothetical protein
MNNRTKSFSEPRFAKVDHFFVSLFLISFVFVFVSMLDIFGNIIRTNNKEELLFDRKKRLSDKKKYISVFFQDGVEATIQ